MILYLNHLNFTLLLKDVELNFSQGIKSDQTISRICFSTKSRIDSQYELVAESLSVFNQASVNIINVSVDN